MSTIVPAPGDRQDGNKRGREGISAGLRFDVLSRCNFACYYCGVPASLGLKVLHVEHVVPVALGGTNDPWNLLASCWDCNLGKATAVPSTELVMRVREDYLAMLAPIEGEIPIVCNRCNLPRVAEAHVQTCESCIDRDISVWEQGQASGRESVSNSEGRW